MKTLIVAGLMLAAASTNASAEWITQVEDDLFSDNKNASMIGLESENWSVIFRCEGPDKVTMAYIEADANTEIETPVPGADMALKIDANDKWTSGGIFYRHNPNFIGVDWAQIDDIPAIVKQIGAARSKIAVGLKFPFTGESSTLSMGTRGSTNAAKRFLESCGIK